MDKNPTEGPEQADSGQGGKFFNGFLLGLLVGAALMFIFGTKKGKKLLKTISEDGAENISNILDKANKTEDSDRVYEEGIEDIVPKREFAVKEIAIGEKPKVRRFFRGISRRVN